MKLKGGNNLDNPFNALIEIIREQGEFNNPVPFFIGTIQSYSPLLVTVSNIQLSTDRFLVNSSLSFYKEDVGCKVLILTNKEQFIIVCKLN